MVNHFRPCQIPLETRELLVEKLCIQSLKKQMLSLLSHIRLIGRDTLGRKLEARSSQPQAEQHHDFSHFHFSRLVYQRLMNVVCRRV